MVDTRRPDGRFEDNRITKKARLDRDEVNRLGLSTKKARLDRDEVNRLKGPAVHHSVQCPRLGFQVNVLAWTGICLLCNDCDRMIMWCCRIQHRQKESSLFRSE